MTSTFDCPTCGSHNRAGLSTDQTAITCSSCMAAIRLKPGAIQGSKLIECPLCGTADMYIQKDFPHRLGLSIVGLGILLSSLAWSQYWSLAALGILLATAALDCCLYYWVGDVTVCYRCLAQYRGAERNPAQKPFDLGVGERYRQERLRLDSLRRAAPTLPSNEVSKTNG